MGAGVASPGLRYRIRSSCGSSFLPVTGGPALLCGPPPAPLDQTRSLGACSHLSHFSKMDPLACLFRTGQGCWVCGVDAAHDVSALGALGSRPPLLDPRERSTLSICRTFFLQWTDLELALTWEYDLEGS